MGYLRALLAITVIVGHSHCGAVFVGGRYAVQMFYIISGFLIAHVIRCNPAYCNPIKFYINRALRIYPIYYCVALITIAYILTLDSAIFAIYEKLPLAAKTLLIVSNSAILGQDWVMFSGVLKGKLTFVRYFGDSDIILWKGLLIPQAWSLGVELTFYAIAPFVLRSTRFIVLLLILSIAIRILLFRTGLGWSDPWTYRFFPTELALFLLGALSNRHVLPCWQRVLKSGELSWLPRLGTCFLLLFCIFYIKIPVNDALKTGLLLLLVMVCLPLAFIYQMTSKIDKMVGELSYPMYISHMLIIWLVNSLLSMGHLKLSVLVQTLINVILSCLFAYLLNKLISERIEVIRAKIRV